MSDDCFNDGLRNRLYLQPITHSRSKENVLREPADEYIKLRKIPTNVCTPLWSFGPAVSLRKPYSKETEICCVLRSSGYSK